MSTKLIVIFATFWNISPEAQHPFQGPINNPLEACGWSDHRCSRDVWRCARSNIYKRPLGGTCTGYSRILEAVDETATVGAEGRDTNRSESEQGGRGARGRGRGGENPGPLQPRTLPRNLIGPNGASTSIINRVQNINDTVTVFQKLN